MVYLSDSTGTEILLKLHMILTEALGSILYFLSAISQSRTLQDIGGARLLQEYPIVTAAVRVLGAWLAEDSLTLVAEVYKLLPFLLELCGTSAPEEVEGEDLLKFLLPGLCHLTADDQGRGILLKTRFQKILFQYMEKLMQLCKKSRYVCPCNNM